MIYYIAQAFGIFATLCCFGAPLFKKKVHMLLITLASNLCFILNLLLLGANEGNLFLNSTAMILNAVGLIQVPLSYWHVQKGTPVSNTENIIFLFLYIGAGFLGYHRLLDLLPIVGSLFFMLSVFQKDEQKTRLLIMGNASIFLIYFIIIGSTSMLAEMIAIASSVTAMIKYRKKA